MGSIEDKNALLSQLKISEKESNDNGLNRNHLFLASIISAVIAGLSVYLMLGANSANKPEQTANVRSESQAVKENALIGESSESKSSSLQAAENNESANFQFSNSNEVLNASGYITARRIATVSSETMGLISSVNVEEGMQVEKGQVLATLDSSVALVNVNLSNARTDVLRARITSTEIDLQEANRVLKRLQQLDKEQYSSESQITKAQADVDKFKSLLVSSKADIKVARLQAEQQQKLLDKFTIRAPFAGVVTVKNAQPGEIVSPSSAGGGFTRTGICTIVDMNSLEIEVDVNEAYIGRVTKNQRVKANLDAYPNWDIPASVIAIIPTADRAKATVRVRIKIENKDSRILPDMGVKVAFLKSNN